MSYYDRYNLANRVGNNNDIIDVRDVIERFEELKEELTRAHDGYFEADFDDWVASVRDNSDPVYDLFRDHDEIDAHEVVSGCEEFYKLNELLEDLAGCGGDHEWEGQWYPVTLIRDSHFRDYAEELADDIGAINKNSTWPNNCIDWDRAASELQMDYSTVEYDGVTYWYR